MTIMILGTVFGSVIIIAVFFPYFLIAVGVIIFGAYGRIKLPDFSLIRRSRYRLCLLLGIVSTVRIPLACGRESGLN